MHVSQGVGSLYTRVQDHRNSKSNNLIGHEITSKPKKFTLKSQVQGMKKWSGINARSLSQQISVVSTQENNFFEFEKPIIQAQV